MANRSRPSRRNHCKNSFHEVDVAIIGGGVAGLYCARALTRAPRRRSIGIFEASARLGGRILTVPVPGRGHAEFLAEFGPMRIEPQHQELLRKLLKELRIKLTDFPAYEASLIGQEPVYHLDEEEQKQESPIDLLKLALGRILRRIIPPEINSSSDAFSVCMRRSTSEICRVPQNDGLQLANTVAALHRWIADLEEDDYQCIREHAQFDGVPLWQFGFWNLLSEVITNDAINKIRDQGTFYHLIYENPNAADWLISCLRGAKSSDKLKGVVGGMQTIVERMVDKLPRQVVVHLRHELTGISPEGDGALLSFRNGARCRAQRVILALPTAPLQRLMLTNEAHFPQRAREAADAVFSYPMLKAFFVVKNRWWNEKYRANKYATRIPTRELHYWLSEQSKRGMIMAYTDRPGSAFWANYVARRGPQDEPEVFVPSRSTKGPEAKDSIVKGQRRRLVEVFLKYLKKNGVNHVGAGDVEWCGIRDWGRAPYSGGCHLWRPERQSWHELKELSGFALVGGRSSPKHIYVCGEAYSDYQGFIEGSLRSAGHVLHKIDSTFSTKTPWLCDCLDCKKVWPR